MLFCVLFLSSGCSTTTFSLYQSNSIDPSSFKKIAVHYFVEGNDIEDPIASQYMSSLLLDGLHGKKMQISQYREILEQFKRESPNYEALSLKDKAKLLTDWELENFDLIIMPFLKVYKTIETYQGSTTVPFSTWDINKFKGVYGSTFFSGNLQGWKTQYITIPGGYVPTGVVVVEIFIVDKNREIVWHFFDKKFSQNILPKKLGAKIINDAIDNMPFK